MPYKNVNKKPSVICISATDPMGLSGVHADMRALASMDVHGMACITATTAQNERGFYQLNPVSDDAFLSQLDALVCMANCHVIKIGLLANARQAEILITHDVFKNKSIILDPVLAASSGSIEQYENRLAGILNLLPHVDLLTPNMNEAKALLGAEIDQHESVEELAQQFLDKGVNATLLKGGHTDEPSLDFYCAQDIQFYLKHEIFEHQYNRGTGCAMASLIAAGLALGATMGDAVTMAKMQMQTGWQSPFSVSQNSGSLGFKKWMTAEYCSLNEISQLDVNLPQVFKAQSESQLTFPACDQPLGLYPIFERASWLERLLPLGIKVAQLRVKDLSGEDLKNEIQMAVNIAKQYDCQLFINDYWQLAIECNAYGVHLGQEDIDDADLQAISEAGLRLGLSSHCFYEVARAKTINPSYIAFGPVYETQSKDMPWVPQGPVGLSYWRKHLPDKPMVAIGGIHGKRFAQVKQTGVDAIAMITAITEAHSPEEAVNQYMAEFNHSSAY